MKIGLIFFSKRTNIANSSKINENHQQVVQVFCVHYKVDTFENVVHGVKIQCISIPIQLFLVL